MKDHKSLVRCFLCTRHATFSQVPLSHDITGALELAVEHPLYCVHAFAIKIQHVPVPLCHSHVGKFVETKPTVFAVPHRDANG
jgi:hypothetical protein